MRNLILTFIVLLGLIVSRESYASGKAVLTPQYYTAHKKILPQAGISIYENLPLSMYYDSYSGFGISPRYQADDVYWLVTRHDIGFELSDALDLKVGATLRLSKQELVSEDESNIHLTLQYQLW